MPELDLAALVDRLAAVGIGEVHPLAGGASSLTYVAVRDGRPVVVKVAPPGVEPVHHRDVLRQARILRALGTTDVPVPDVLHEDPGSGVDVPPLFVMSFVAGSSVEPLFDLADPDVSADVMAARLHDAVRVLARLHRVVPAQAGLAREPAVPLGEEVERWSRTLRTLDPMLVPRWEEAADALRRAVPVPVGPAVLHGDFRLGNLLATGTRITAVIDWEIWSVGDPRTDLGWFLLNADPETYRRPTPYQGRTPSPGVLAAAYADVSGHDVRDVAWFVALAAFKSAATWGLIIKHNRRRARPDADLEAMAEHLPRLIERVRGVTG